LQTFPCVPVVGGRGREDGTSPVCRGPHPPARCHLHWWDRLAAVSEDRRGTWVVTSHQDRVSCSTRECLSDRSSLCFCYCNSLYTTI